MDINTLHCAMAGGVQLALSTDEADRNRGLAILHLVGAAAENIGLNPPVSLADGARYLEIGLEAGRIVDAVPARALLQEALDWIGDLDEAEAGGPDSPAGKPRGRRPNLRIV